MNSRIVPTYFCLVLMLSLLLAFIPSPRAAELPTVVVFATGGTIACLPDPQTGALRPAVTGEELVKSCPGISELAKIKVVEFANIISLEMTPEIWINMHKELTKILDDPEVTGVVITHGTCTIDLTAFFLDLTLTSNKPVVVTGAMVSAKKLGSDGPKNLLNAVKVAVSKEAIGKGVMVVLNDYINGARAVRKTHEWNPQTFTSGVYGYLGYVDVDKVRFYHDPLPRPRLPVPEKPPRVDVIHIGAGTDPGYVKYAADSGADGIILSGVCAYIRGAVTEAAKYAAQKGVVLVLSSRIHDGQIIPLYGGPGGPVTLQKFGVVLGADLSPDKAKVLLTLVLPITKDPKQIQGYFDKFM